MAAGGGMTDDQMAAAAPARPPEPTVAERLHAARVASRRVQHGPRTYADDELGIDAGPLTQQRLYTGLPIFSPPRTEQQSARIQHGELGDDPTAQLVAGTVLGGGAGQLATDLGIAAGLPAPLARIGGGAVSGGTVNKIQGGDFLPGAALGAVATAVPEGIAAVDRGAQSLATKARTALRDPRGEVGRSIADYEKAQASGITKTPEFKQLAHGAHGFNQAATTAEEALGAHTHDVLQQARADYGQELDDILNSRSRWELPGTPPRTYTLNDTHNLLNDIEKKSMVNGVKPKKLGELFDAIDETRRMLTKDTGILDRQASATSMEQGGPAVTITAPAATIPDIMATKRLVADMADYGTPATPVTRLYRQIDQSLSRDLSAADPRISSLNKRYADTMGKLEEANDILYGSQNPEVVRTTAKQRRARGLLGRVGDNTQAATLAAKDIERLKQLDPRYKEILAPVEAKKAVERVAYGMPHVSRRIEHLPLAFVKQNLDALGVRVADPILGRLQLREPFSGQVPPEAIALAAQKARDEERAKTLLGGP